MNKRIIAVLLSIALLTVSFGVDALEIDGKVSKTDSDTERAISTGSYRITEKDPFDIILPDSIPDEYLDPIEKRLNDASYACALYYIDLETGFTVSYNAERYFRGASLVKAPYMMAVLDKVGRGKVSLDSEYTYTNSFNRTGTVRIPQDYESGEKLTLKQIIEYLIYYSDNTAFAMLLSKVCSISEFKSHGKSEYDTDFYHGGTNWLTAHGVASAFEDLYKRSKNGERNYVWLIELMKQANENVFINYGIPVDENGKRQYVVAHKYGMDINSSNDAAIVFYKERPYALVLLTDYIGYNTSSFMAKISADVFKMHEYVCSFDVKE